MKNANIQSWRPEPLAALQPADWLSLAAVLAVAIALRALFYTGFFGSDEVTYVEMAVRIVSGDWRASDYIGATRYGMNLPVALCIYLFGLSEASANLWPFLCSVGEVALVFVIARWLWNTRAAVVSAGLLALLPVHVNFAGRMFADPPLAFFLTLSVALLLRATSSRSALMYFAAGLAWGGVFWVKESVGLLYLPVLLLLTIFRNRLTGPWLWLCAGAGVAVLANCALMSYVADNSMHVLAVMKHATLRISGMTLETSPWYYFRYLFIDIRHTLLLGYLGLAGTILYAKYFARDKNAAPGAQFVVVWVLLMLGMFTFAVVSVSPVKLIMKQINYMLIFAGPLVLLAGWFMAALPRRTFMALSGLVVCGSVVLCALEQQAVTVFTANSKAVYTFLREHPNTYIIGATNNQRAVNFYSMMENRWNLRDRILSFGEMEPLTNPSFGTSLKTRASGKDAYAVLDLQLVGWGNKPGALRGLTDVPNCWKSMGVLTPAELGTGHWISQGLVAAVSLLPAVMQQRFMSILQPVYEPGPAYLFRIEDSCLTGLVK